jgi:hypothetical protein
MALIATLIEPNGVTRVLFDCRKAAPDQRDLDRIARAIEQSMTSYAAGDTIPDDVPSAGKVPAIRSRRVRAQH